MTTQQVAVKLGITREQVLTIVNHYPHLRPAKMGGQGYIWSNEEAEALQAYLAQQSGRS